MNFKVRVGPLKAQHPYSDADIDDATNAATDTTPNYKLGVVLLHNVYRRVL